MPILTDAANTDLVGIAPPSQQQITVGPGGNPGSAGPLSLDQLYPEVSNTYAPETPTIAGPTQANVTENDPASTFVDQATIGSTAQAGVTENDPASTFVDQATVGSTAQAGVTENDTSVTSVGTPGVATANTGVLSQAQGVTASQTALTPEQQVDAELNRITSEDSPYLSQARVRAAQQANRRGLQNSSIAAGMATAERVNAALPIAQQNASQAATRELSNTQLEQAANTFTAQEQNRHAALEAELGTRVSLFNAEQLNQAENLSAQMRTALEQQDTAAYNAAAQQFAQFQQQTNAQQADISSRANELQAQMRAAQEQQDTAAYNAAAQQFADLTQRTNAQQGDIDARANELQAQMTAAQEQQDTAAYNAAAQQLAQHQQQTNIRQADIEFAGEQQATDAQNRINEQRMAQITQLNDQFLRGSQAMDLATIQGNYQQIISSNATAGSLYQSYFNSIGNVVGNHELTPSQQASSINVMQRTLEASLRMITEMSRVDPNAPRTEPTTPTPAPAPRPTTPTYPTNFPGFPGGSPYNPYTGPYSNPYSNPSTPPTIHRDFR